MHERLSRLPTRSARPGHAPPAPSALAADQEVRSSETGLGYRIESPVGAGGFGQVYLARRLEPHDALVPEVVCIKASSVMDGWLREAYFGQRLRGHPRAIQVFDRFVLARPDAPPLYCLAIEYACDGDLSAFLHRTGRPWPERTARREIAGILSVLGKLHRGELLHRDLTPMNVFVCERRRLKLGDFGIVRAFTERGAPSSRTLNPAMAPSEVVAGIVPKWQARDDVYQVGQLLAMLVKGDAGRRIRSDEVRHLACSDHLKEIVHRYIGERRKRYRSATELIEALKQPPSDLRRGRLASLSGVHLAFTGILSQTRAEAAKAARRAGATVHGGPSALTGVVVRGRPNPLQAAGRDGGLKLMEIKRLREKGHRITLLDERQFWRLAGKR